MTERKVAALLAVIVLGLAAFWPERLKEESFSAPQKAESPLPAIVAEVRPEQAAEIAAAVPVVAAIPDTQVRVPGPPGPMSAAPSPGMYRKYPSDDFSMYMALMNISDSAPVAGMEIEPREKAMLRALLRMNDLTDDELGQLLEYSKVVKESDRVNQATEQERICAERGRFTSLDQFGAAMNGYNKHAEAHQEELGRNARVELGPVLYSRLSSALQGRTRHEITDYDAVLLLNSQNRGVGEVIDKFCSYDNGNRTETSQSG